MKISNLKNLSIVLLILSVLSIGCFMTEGIEAGEKAVNKFHEQFNNNEIDEIYNDADQQFKESDSKESIIGFLEKVRKRLGKVKDTKRTGWNVNKNLKGTFATVNFETEFENGKGTETFIFLLADEDTKLLNYNVNSKALLAD